MFVLVRWNRKYGDGARLIIQNKTDKKFTLFTPGHTKDIAWTDKDLSKVTPYNDWDKFEGVSEEDKEIHNLEDIML